VLLGIVILLSFTENININDMKYTMVEYFAGKGNVSSVFSTDRGQRAVPFEIRTSKSMDFNSSAGMALLVNT